MPPTTLGQLPANPGFKKQFNYVAQNVPYVPGATTTQYDLPTELPLECLVFHLHGTPAGTTSGAGTLNAPFQQDAYGNNIVPALANAIGKITITGSPQDGSDGVRCNNVSAAAIALDSYLMTGTVPSSNVDFNVSTPATACSATVFLHFQDETLGANGYLTALEAMRYGSEQALQVQVLFGDLNDAALKPDMSVSVGGTYSGLGAGTLVLDIGYWQLVPTNFDWPDYTSPNAFPTFDRDFEYILLPNVSQTNSNAIVLTRRRVQANTWWALTQVSGGVEVGYNNLGVSPDFYLEQKLGGQTLDKILPDIMRSNGEILKTYGHTGVPTGVYPYDDWNDSLVNLVSLLTAKGNHTWNTNMGSSSNNQNLRVLHITYNPSARAHALNPSL